MSRAVQVEPFHNWWGPFEISQLQMACDLQVGPLKLLPEVVLAISKVKLSGADSPENFSWYKYTKYISLGAVKSINYAMPIRYRRLVKKFSQFKTVLTDFTPNLTDKPRIFCLA